MPASFYQETGSLISPGDIFERLPYMRLPNPIQVARKPAYSLPKTYKITGELREIFEVGRHRPKPDYCFDPPSGEEVLSQAKMSKAVFLTWGSEVEDDERSGKLHKKDWLIAPIFPLSDLEKATVQNMTTGETIRMVDAILGGKSPRFFPLKPFPDDKSIGHYVDFRKICSLVANHFAEKPRRWRLGPEALNDFYHQLIWFFTRKRIFFSPIACPGCGNSIDLNVTFEGQPINEAE